MIKDKIKLISKTKGIKNKIKVLNYFLTGYMFPCEINISNSRKLFVRQDEPNDLFMAMDSDKEFFNYVKEKEFKNIIDIGANIGKYSLLFSENKDSKIISFEPFLKNYEALVRNIELNKVKNISAYNFGCFDENGEKKINLCKENEGANSIFFDRGFKKIKIEVVKLDSFLREYHEVESFSPDLIKIDVEGVELNVLKGAMEIIEQYKPVIFLEILNQKEEIFKLLKDSGYKVEDFGNDNYLAEVK